jgi:hypothetical protein
MSTLRASLCFLLLLPGAALAQPAAPNPSFNLVNRGSTAIKEFFATPAGRPNWGLDRLNGKGLAAGGKAAVRLPADGNCIYDLRAVFADGRSEDNRGKNVCQVEDIGVGEASPGAAKSFRLLNRGTAPITSIALRPQGSDKSRNNDLGGIPIPPGGERRFELPPGGQCVYDLRAIFAGGKRRILRDLDLCKSPDQEVQQPEP